MKTKISFNQITSPGTWSRNPPPRTWRHKWPQLNELTAACYTGCRLPRYDWTVTDTELVPHTMLMTFPTRWQMRYAKKPPHWTMKQNKNNCQHLVQRQRTWTLTTLWRRRCTARSRWPRRFGSSDTRRVCTSCTGWRKRSGCSWAPGTCRSCADCICRCRVWRLSSSRPAAPSSTFWPQQKTESFNDVWGQHKQTELCIFLLFFSSCRWKGKQAAHSGPVSHRTRLSSACLSSSSRRSTSRISSCSYSDRKLRLMPSAAWGMVPGTKNPQRGLPTFSRCLTKLCE